MSEELKRTYNPCDECPYGIEKRDGSGNDSTCKICEFADLVKANRRAQQPNEPLMVTFPCKMGDTVYEVEDGLPIISYRVTGFVLGKTEFEDEDDIEARLGWQVEYGKYGVDCECPISEFGKSLFLTHEAAEQALAYRRPLEAGEKE